MAINLVQGDTGPQVKVTLTRSDTGAVQDLTGATVVMRFRKKRATAVLFTLTNQSGDSDKSAGIALFAVAELHHAVFVQATIRNAAGNGGANDAGRART